MKTLKGWDDSNLNLKEYIAPGDEVDDDLVYEMAGTVPPLKWNANILMVGEQVDARGYDTFVKTDERWKYIGVKQPEEKR